jgi:Uma2 family endonuclease
MIAMDGPPMRMTLHEFLRWDDGTETRYELLGGLPAPIPLSIEAQRMLAVRLATRIDARLSDRRPCNAQFNAGVIPPDCTDTFFVADLAATCAPIEAARQAMRDPLLIVEILSPSTERLDHRVKLPAYRQIETVQEIALVAFDEMYVEVHRRAGSQWITEILRGGEAVLSLASVPIEIRLSNLYEGIALSDAESSGAAET